jgi:pimeloyl-ACP methyl ester carboxylesterase/predicted glycosyltransferase
MHAIAPAESGLLSLHGYTIAYEVFGSPTAPPVLLLPCWQIAPHRQWKMQVPDLTRCFRVIAWDPPGIGGGERTTDAPAYEYDRIVDYGVGLLDYLGIAQADILGFSRGGLFGLWMAARYPERVRRAVFVGTSTPESRESARARSYADFWEPRPSYEGWEKRNLHYWRVDFADWLDFFFHQVVTEPHSTRLIEEFISWAQETTPDVLAASVANPDLLPELSLEEVLERVRCPVMLIHGTDDQIASAAFSQELAERRPDFDLLLVEGGGHAVHGRNPVRINLECRAFFAAQRPQQRTWPRALARDTRRALFVSSPIGLGHVQRDLAIARELRQQVPGLQIDWLAQHPVTQVLATAGEVIHPLSDALLSESAHWERESGEHTLHAFQAFRRMDAILLANFMIFLDAVRDTPYDLWIGDEAWDVDYYLHENPELKTAPYVFMTDFLGWLPVDPDPDSHEAALTADYNAEMLEHIARFPRVRDRALYFGALDDLVPDDFGPGLPSIRAWTAEHFTPVGYVVPFDPADNADTAALRARLELDPDRPFVVVAVGGTAVGAPLLQRIRAAWPLIQQKLPDAHGLLVTGPRIDPATIPPAPGLTVRPYVHDLHRWLAAADLGIVQGGLSTTMELTVSRRPFVYVPLQQHCEQLFHVAHRLDRYHAGHRLDYADLTPASLADAAVATLAAGASHYRPHVPGAAAHTASLIAALL